MRETKHHKIRGISAEQRREKGDTRETEGPGQANPQRLSGTWVKAQDGKGGANGQGMMPDAGMQRGVQR